MSALNAVWTEIIDRAGAVRPPITRLPLNVEFERSIDGVGALMTGAGLASVHAEEVSWTFRIRPDDLWTAVPAGIAVIGAVYLAQDVSTRQRMRDAFDVVTAAQARGGVLELPMTAVLGTGTVP